MTEDPTALAQQIREWLTIGDGKAYYGVEGKWAQCRVCHAYADGPSELAERHIEDRPYLWCATAWLEAAAAALEGVQGQVGRYQQICDVAATNLYRAEQAEASLAALQAGIKALAQEMCEHQRQMTFAAASTTDREAKAYANGKRLGFAWVADKLEALCRTE